MSKKKNTQKKLINELKNQLFIQAERLGIREEYSPVSLAEMKLDATQKILTEFYMERANLLYELNMLGSKKKEVLIKLERLNAYVRKAEGINAKHKGEMEKQIEQGQGDIKKTKRAVSRFKPARVSAAA